MGGDAVFGGVMHFPCADLHFKGNALLADHRCVQRLVHVRLWRRDIVLEAAGYRLHHIVNYAEHVIAVIDGVDDNAHGVNVIDFIQ